MTKAEVLRIAQEVGLVDWVSDDGEYFRFAEHEEMSDKLIAFAKEVKLSDTPSSNWQAEGLKDPHGDRYDCERSDLAMGHLTDDELANAAYLNYDRRLTMEEMLAGKPGPLVYMTAVKDRIRWLSRQLEKALRGKE